MPHIRRREVGGPPGGGAAVETLGAGGNGCGRRACSLTGAWGAGSIMVASTGGGAVTPVMRTDVGGHPSKHPSQRPTIPRGLVAIRPPLGQRLCKDGTSPDPSPENRNIGTGRSSASSSASWRISHERRTTAEHPYSVTPIIDIGAMICNFLDELRGHVTRCPNYCGLCVTVATKILTT
jgi:hypothetical protein